MSKVWRPHSEKQERAVLSKAPIVLAGSGIQWGKTTIGAVKMKVALHTFTDPTDAFIVVAPTYKILQQSTLPAFMALMRDCGVYSASDSTFKMRGGGIVYFRTTTDPDSIVGITNVRAIWGDEAGLFTLYAWENIQARAAFREAPIWLTTSPYTLNWIYKEIIRPKRKDPAARKDVELVQAASWENPYMPASVIERARESMDPRRFNALFGGQWERMSGLVYDCMDEVENQCDAFPIPPGTRMVAGIDWGFTDPFVFKVRAITPDGRHWGVQEIYRTQLTINVIAETVMRLVQTWGITTIYAGPDQPGYIEELNRQLHKMNMACTVVPANNDVRLGIDRHYELLKTRRLKYFRGANPHTLDEYDTYHYPEPKDAGPDQNTKDLNPVKQHDHAMDCCRYISIMTANKGQIRAPFVPEERVAERAKNHFTRDIFRRKRATTSENWS